VKAAALAAGAEAPELHNNLGVARRDAGDAAGAETAFRAMWRDWCARQG
jgi:hypothetical protein